jgi:hypothetical protein
MGEGTGPYAGGLPAEAEASTSHVATGEDTSKVEAREERLAAILARAEERDRAAEHRDREAKGRLPVTADPHAVIDREWAARDRDRAAEDRADLVALLREDDSAPKPDEATELS